MLDGNGIAWKIFKITFYRFYWMSICCSKWLFIYLDDVERERNSQKRVAILYSVELSS